MREVVAVLLAAVVLAGCALPFCGPTIYHLTAVSASAEFANETWEPDRVKAGLREAGFAISTLTPDAIEGAHGEARLRAEAGGGGPIRVIWGVPTPGIEGERDEVERTAASIVAEHAEEARATLDAFARGAGWTIATPMEWDKAMLHGDC